MGIFSKLLKPLRRRSSSIAHILVDSSTYATLAVSNLPSVIALLSEWVPDVRCVWFANHPNYLKDFFILRIPPNEYPQWTWAEKARVFTHTPAAVLTPALRAKAELADAKAGAISTITLSVNEIRFQISTGYLLQDSIYLTKRQQAEAFRNGGYDESWITEYPYVLQYAIHDNCSFKQAADDILFKAKLNDAFLAKTEGLRMKYLERLRRASNLTEIPVIRKEFLWDCNKAQIT